MPDDLPVSIDVFDPNSDTLVVHRKLPHWGQAGTLCFITFRTDDSIPNDVLKRWHTDRRAWLRRHGIVGDGDWRAGLAKLDRPLQMEFMRTFSRRWHDALDAGHGECVLKRPALAEIVAGSLQHFDNQRYVLTDFVVMPNHVHVLAAFADDEALLEQCESWKHFTATQINRHLGRRGRFWQQDGFDHLVRSEEQFLRLRRYIESNPHAANLQVGEYLHYSRTLRGAV